MNIAIINDGSNNKQINELMVTGLSIGKNCMMQINPGDIIGSSAHKNSELFIIAGIRRFSYQEMREILFECYERRCPYVSLEYDDEKLKHAFTNFSYFMRALVVLVSYVELQKKFIHNSIDSVLFDDAFSAWKLINQRVKNAQ